MESIGKIAKFKFVKTGKPKINPHLHSPAHLLADEMCKKFNDKKHFGFYLKMAITHNHDYLRGLMGQVLENSKVETPGKLFAYLIKKNNQELKDNVKFKYQNLW
jgi:hypothetical protein